MLRVYRLYPTGPNGITSESVYYRGVLYDVIANNVRQAYVLARKKIWTTDPLRAPGIAEIYERDAGYTLWCCGFVGHAGGLGLEHYKGVRHIRERLRLHQEHHADSDPGRPF